MEELRFRNESGLNFIDISSEMYREYHWISSRRKGSLKIYNPMRLYVSESGGHRVINRQGECFYVKPTFDYIKWKPNLDMPHFVK